MDHNKANSKSLGISEDITRTDFAPPSRTYTQIFLLSDEAMYLEERGQEKK